LRIKQQILEGNREMNTPIDPQVQETPPQINEQRRRLAKVGLAAPVVMGTLLSRPVLGAGPFHNCTISGQLSGNTSTHEQAETCAIGEGPITWGGKTTWTGTSPLAPTTLLKNTSVNGKTFELAYKKKSKTVASVITMYLVGTDTGGASDVTLKDVLTLPAWPGGSGMTAPINLDLGKAAIANTLNALVIGTTFPLKPEQVIDMFNQTHPTGTYQINDTLSWNAASVLAYFITLYPLNN
jgi:hypothetical protein